MTIHSSEGFYGRRAETDRLCGARVIRGEDPRAMKLQEERDKREGGQGTEGNRAAGQRKDTQGSRLVL